MTRFLDVADFDEDDRITMIGRQVTKYKKMVAFIVEDNEKADRYMRKLKKKFPTIKEIGRGKGPMPDVIYVKVAEVQ